MLAESLLLSLFAGALAVVIGNWVAGALVHVRAPGHFRDSPGPAHGWRDRPLCFALSLVACVTFGLAPAIHATRFNLVGMLKTDSGASIGDLSSGWFRKLLVVSQVAFSLVLLIAAGIFVRTMLNLWPTDYGAHPERVLLFTLKPQGEIYTPVQRRALIAELVRRVSDLPGVEAAGVAEYGPLGIRVSESPASIEAEAGHPVRAETDWVSTGFFDAAGIPHIAGRDFTLSDKAGSPLVVIINQSLARKLFGNANPLGRSIRFTEEKDARPFEIVGVVADSRYYEKSMAHHNPPSGSPSRTMQRRTCRRCTSAAAAGIPTPCRRRSGASWTPSTKGFRSSTSRPWKWGLNDGFARDASRESLGCCWIPGVGARRCGPLSGLWRIRCRGELGRSVSGWPLGPSARSVIWMVAREALFLIGVGSVGGIILSLAGWRLLSERMPGVSTIDTQIVIVCATIMLILAAAAVSIPATRACRIDPLIALRHE